jgi:hypothetical protein
MVERTGLRDHLPGRVPDQSGGTGRPPERALADRGALALGARCDLRRRPIPGPRGQWNPASWPACATSPSPPTPERRPQHRLRHPPPRPPTRTPTTNDQELLTHQSDFAGAWRRPRGTFPERPRTTGPRSTLRKAFSVPARVSASLGRGREHHLLSLIESLGHQADLIRTMIKWWIGGWVAPTYRLGRFRMPPGSTISFETPRPSPI